MALPRVGSAMAQVMAPGTSSTLTIAATQNRTSGAVGSGTAVVRLVATSDCFVAFGGSTVAATSSDMFLPSGVVEEFQVVPNATYISVIQDAAGGTLYITEME